MSPGTAPPHRGFLLAHDPGYPPPNVRQQGQGAGSRGRGFANEASGGLSGRTGTPWTQAAYQSWRRRAFTRAIEAARVGHGRQYDLRHSFASLLLHEGRSVIYAARQLGHDARLTLSTYGHVMDEFEDMPRHDAHRDRRRPSRGRERRRGVELSAQSPPLPPPPPRRLPDRLRASTVHQGCTRLARSVSYGPPPTRGKLALTGIYRSQYATVGQPELLCKAGDRRFDPGWLHLLLTHLLTYLLTYLLTHFARLVATELQRALSTRLKREPAAAPFERSQPEALPDARPEPRRGRSRLPPARRPRPYRGRGPYPTMSTTWLRTVPAVTPGAASVRPAAVSASASTRSSRCSVPM